MNFAAHTGAPETPKLETTNVYASGYAHTGTSRSNIPNHTREAQNFETSTRIVRSGVDSLQADSPKTMHSTQTTCGLKTSECAAALPAVKQHANDGAEYILSFFLLFFSKFCFVIYNLELRFCIRIL